MSSIRPATTNGHADGIAAGGGGVGAGAGAGSGSSASIIQPVPTLYVNNLDTKVKKQELKQQLYALFTPYGKIIDLVAAKGEGRRGQAFVVFAEQAHATAAMRALSGEEFYGRSLQISYAKHVSKATKAALDPLAKMSGEGPKKGRVPKAVFSRAQDEFEELAKERQDEEEGRGKRAAEEGEGAEDEARDPKRRKVDDEDEEEMEMDDDDDGAGPSKTASAGSAVLLASNLPEEADESVIGPLFKQYPGFRSLSLLPVGSTPTKSASVTFTTTAQAEAAQKALNGFELKQGSRIAVVVVPADAL